MVLFTRMRTITRAHAGKCTHTPTRTYALGGRVAHNSPSLRMLACSVCSRTYSHPLPAQAPARERAKGHRHRQVRLPGRVCEPAGVDPDARSPDPLPQLRMKRMPPACLPRRSEPGRLGPGRPGEGPGGRAGGRGCGAGRGVGGPALPQFTAADLLCPLPVQSEAVLRPR
jgi:hypothetical protein